MRRTFEIFRHPLRDLKAVKSGFSWPGFFFTWIWAFVSRLWILGGLLFLVSLVFGLLPFLLSFQSPFETRVLLTFLGLVVQIITGLKGNSWKSDALQHRGY